MFLICRPLGDSSSSSEEAALPFVRVLSQFRDEVRGVAREIKAVSILQSCDNVRDNVLPELGVRLEDREVGEPAVFKVHCSMSIKCSSYCSSY